MNVPRVVLFDLDDTLFTHTQALARGFAAHLRSCGGGLSCADPELAMARWRQLEELHYEAHLLGQVSFVEQRRRRVREFFADYGNSIANDAEADAWFKGYYGEYQRAWAVYDDVFPTLDSLPGLRLGIITNGDLKISLAKMECLGLLPRMVHVVASGQLGVAKPHPRIFVHTCELFSVAPQEALYVGDRLETDAIGAVEAGLTGVWLNRTGQTPGPGAERVRTIASLRELIGLWG